MTTAPPDVLQAILAATRARVASARARESDGALARRARLRTPRGDAFAAALHRADHVNVIAECKRRSPSRGVLRAAYDPVAIARGYETAGAAALSVLTEPSFFDGSIAHLAAVRDAVALPLLRKDFVVDPYQLHESVAAGADAVLLIAAALSDDQLGALVQEAASLGLAALVEVHTEDELIRALSAGARIVGVNNRNLRTLDVDVTLSDRLSRLLPPAVGAVSESGLRRAAELVHLRALGYHACLVGERFMTAPDPGRALACLLAEARR